VHLSGQSATKQQQRNVAIKTVASIRCEQDCRHALDEGEALEFNGFSDEEW
jgi:hypothetical protein